MRRRTGADVPHVPGMVPWPPRTAVRWRVLGALDARSGSAERIAKRRAAATASRCVTAERSGSFFPGRRASRAESRQDAHECRRASSRASGAPDDDARGLDAHHRVRHADRRAASPRTADSARAAAGARRRARPASVDLARRTADEDEGQPRPVLVPVVDHDRRARVRAQVAQAQQVARRRRASASRRRRSRAPSSSSA